MKRPVVLPVVLLLLAFPFLSIAQSAVKVSADIPFDFFIGKDRMPAGVYSFSFGGKTGVMVTGAKTGRNVMAVVLTRISQYSNSETSVVFDKVGEDHYLSELHVAGTDGYHFLGAPGPHTHETIRIKR